MSCKLTEDAKAYLSRYYQILEDMISGMGNAECSHSISHDFIVQMLLHQKAAIEMSKNLLWYNPSAPLKKVARDVISGQSRSIADMKAILDECGAFVNSERDLMLYRRRMDNMMSTMFTQMEYVPDTNNIDVNFMRGMLPQRKGAVCMAETALQYELCPKLVPLLEATVSSQEEVIREMEALLRRTGGFTLPVVIE